jgi:hypothetical protein
MAKQWKPVTDYERIDLPVAGTWLGIREEGSIIGLGNSQLLIKAKLPRTLRVCELVDAGATVQMSEAQLAALKLYLHHYTYRDKDWGGYVPELEQAYNTLTAMLQEATGGNQQ